MELTDQEIDLYDNTVNDLKEENEKLMLPLTIQVSHAIADGYHVALLVDNLQKELNLVNL